MIERRRAERLPCSLQLEVKRSRGWISYEALDPSFRGLFVRFQDPVLPNQLIQLRVFVGSHQAPLEMLARVVRQSSDEEIAGSDRLTGPDRSAGSEQSVGTALEFFSLKGETLQRWLQFLNLARRLLAKDRGARRREWAQQTTWQPGATDTRGLSSIAAGDALTA